MKICFLNRLQRLLFYTQFATLILIQSACNQTYSGENSSGHEMAADSGYIRYAKGFQIQDHGSFRILTIRDPFSVKSSSDSYLLVRKGEPVPKGYENTPVIRVPVDSIAVTSSLHVGAIDRLEAWEQLVALGDADQIYAEKVLERIGSESVSQIMKGTVLDEEKVISLQPDVLIVTGGPHSGIGSYEKIIRSGIPVVINSEWMENNPLGRAEWIKFMAALLDRQNMADHQFAFVESGYLHLTRLVKEKVSQKPRVILGNEFQGTWHMPGGASYMAAMLADAGADYPWESNRQTGGIPLNFESVYPEALQADVWLNIFVPTVYGKKEEVLSANPRYRDFKSVKNGEMYSFTNRVNSRGANDYWESSAFRPDLLLADYIKILHPELLPEHTLYYCKKLD